MTTQAANTQDAFFGNTIASWTLASGDDGAPLGNTGSGDRTVQVDGTFGSGGNLIIEGSLNNGASWYQLRDTSGTLLSFTSGGLRIILENTLLIRPRVISGDGTTSLTAIISVRKVHNV